MKEDAAALSVASSSTAPSAAAFFIPADTRRFRGGGGRAKRCIDVMLAGLAIVVSAPLWAFIAIVIKRTSPGPVFFIQERLGRDGRPFRFYKFRSMRHDSDDTIHRQFTAMFISGNDDACRQQNGNQNGFKLESDPRVTAIGRWLRRTSLDELPQLINVLRGEMSLVGPRPPISYELESYQPWHLERLKVTPGLTGLWQVMGRSQVSFDEMVQLDLHYINQWSLWLDLRIMLRTVPVVLRGTGGL